jgi:putative nucleotidyltransferase with HDIG domain
LREPLLGVGVAMAVVPVALLHFLATREASFGSAEHAIFVGAGASAATVASVVLTIAAARRHDGRSVGVGTAFSVMAALLVLHGVATPGFLVESNGLVEFSGGMTLPVGAALLTLCAFPALRSPGAAVPLLAFQGVLLAGVAALGIVGLAAPDSIPEIPEPRSTAAYLALAIGLLFYGAVSWRALRTYRLTHRFTDLLVVVGLVWLIGALAAATLLYWGDLGWWIGHGLEVAGITAIGVPVAVDLRRAVQSRPLLGDLSAADLVAQEEAFLGAQVSALTQLLANRDADTEEHTRRVALRAVLVGEELGLPPERLRVLAAGGLLHDMGKLSVPDEILMKPGPLTDEEYAVIKRHPQWGEELLRTLGFADDVRRIVLHHHERIDGSGYPFGARGEQIAIEAKILGVCDVYDALISPRVYRGAWARGQAIDFLREHSGTAFDPRVVAALQRVLARERPHLALAS